MQQLDGEEHKMKKNIDQTRLCPDLGGEKQKRDGETKTTGGENKSDEHMSMSRFAKSCGMPLGGIWDVSRRYLKVSGSIWQAIGRLLGSRWGPRGIC